MGRGGTYVAAVASVYDDPQALAKAIREARGSMTQRQLAEPIGVSAQKVKRWEAGQVASLGDTPEKRRATAVLVAEVTGRRDLLGLGPAPGATEDAGLQRQIDELRGQLERHAGMLVRLARLNGVPAETQGLPEQAEGDRGA